MTNITEEISNLKRDVATIMSRYKIHPDDRDIIIEKIDQALADVLTAQKHVFETELTGIRSEIGIERVNVRKEVDAIRNSAVSKLSEIRGKINEAYDDGVTDGLSQTPPTVQAGPSTFTVVLGLFFAALAIVVIAGGLFQKKKES
jgi:hypothetical protein